MCREISEEKIVIFNNAKSLLIKNMENGQEEEKS